MVRNSGSAQNTQGGATLGHSPMAPTGSNSMQESPSQMKKVFLQTLIVSVVLGAILGIVIILRDTWGWFEVRVIITTITIAVASLCGLACELSRMPRGGNLLPLTGIVLTAVAAAMVLLLAWTEFHEKAYVKLTVSLVISAVATVHVCLLSIARLKRRFRWVYVIASQTIYGFAALLISMVVFEWDSDGLLRTTYVLSIIVAALTLVIPILYRIGKAEGREVDELMPVERAQHRRH